MVFVVGIFFLKQKSEYKNEIGDKVGLAYGEVKVGDLINKDSDSDKIPDWEENLFGTDPNNKDTDGDGANDDIAIAKIKSSNEILENDQKEVLTETDKFSRELFSTIVTMAQAGPIDENAADKLGATLSDQIKNPKARKVFLASEIKTAKSDDVAAINKYKTDLIGLDAKFKTSVNALEILKEFSESGDEPDASILSKLDPIISETKKLITGMSKIEVPQSLVLLHLNLINSMELTTENLEDLQFFEADILVAMSGISQYEKNSELLQASARDLGGAIMQKLGN